MSPLCRKSNRCAAGGALLLHGLLFASLFLGVSMAHQVPNIPAVESMYITLAEAVNAPQPPAQAAPPPPEEIEIPQDPVEPLPDKVSIKPEPKKQPKETSKPKPKPQPPVTQQTRQQEQAETTHTSGSTDPKVDQQARQNAISALLAKLEKEKRYPNSARRMGLEGQVFINVELDSRGAIRSYRLDGADTHPILQKSAMQAMERVYKKWQPVAISSAVTVQIPVRFELH